MSRAVFPSATPTYAVGPMPPHRCTGHGTSDRDPYDAAGLDSRDVPSRTPTYPLVARLALPMSLPPPAGRIRSALVRLPDPPRLSRRYRMSNISYRISVRCPAGESKAAMAKLRAEVAKLSMEPGEHVSASVEGCDADVVSEVIDLVKSRV